MPNDNREINQRRYQQGHQPDVPGRSGHETIDSTRYLRNSNQSGSSESGMMIPRVKTTHPTQKSADQKSLRRFDTFGVNAIETIYDEFRFLDESETPSPSSTQPILHNAKRRSRCPSPLYVLLIVLSLIQLLGAVALLVMAIFRYYDLLGDVSTSFVDFVKPEGPNIVNASGYRIFRLRTASSAFLPSFFQFLSAVCGLWPLIIHRRRYLQVLHVIFSMLTILVSFGLLEQAVLEANLQVVQLKLISEDSTYSYIIACLAVACAVLVLIPTLAIILSTTYAVPRGKHRRSSASISLAIGSSILCAAAICFSSFAVMKTMSTVPLPSIFYGIGVRELIVTSHAVICSMFYFMAGIVQNVRFTIAAILLLLVNVLSLAFYILTPSRILATILNVQTLGIAKNVGISRTYLALMYILTAALFVAYCCQLVATIFSLRSSTNSTARSQQQTSF